MTDKNTSSIASMVEKLGPLGPGQLGFVIATPGVGKSALVAELAVARTLEDTQVLHVALNEPVAHVRRHYDEVFGALEQLHRTDRDHVLKAERNRLILSYDAREFSVAHLKDNLATFKELAHFEPDFIVVDEIDPAEVETRLNELQGLAKELGASLWLTVDDRGDVAKNLELLQERCTLGLKVRSDKGWLELTVLVGPGMEAPAGLELARDAAAAMRSGPGHVKARDCVLYSGGAKGAEALFGKEAARWGAREVNFTFDGHNQERTDGQHVLTSHELAGGNVSLAYVSQRLHRKYSDKGLIKRVLQTLWHVVSRSQQVFVVGEIQDDGTVIGGTGWSVELAKMWHKPLWVYCQGKNGWFSWNGTDWEPGEPVVQYRHFAGTGTRNLTDEGRAAVKSLFERSFSA